METDFKVTRKSREIYMDFLNNYSLEQLNKIPAGFSNNLFWNIAHVVVSQQMIVYRLSGQPGIVSEELINRYRRGTRPERDVTAEEVEEIKGLLFTTIEKTEEDYRNGLFTTFHEYKTELGFVMSAIEDAITFNNYHEALHLGVMMGIRKFL